MFSKDAIEVVFATAFLHSVRALHNMGCMKSKQTFPFPTTLESEKRHVSEENFMPEEKFLNELVLTRNTQEISLRCDLKNFFLYIVLPPF